MVDWSALKLVALAMAGMAAFVLAGAAMRFASRILSFALLALLIVGAGYVVYELVSGWTAAGPDERSADRSAPEADSVEGLRAQYVESELSEAEFEAELASVMDDDSDEQELTLELDEET